MSKNLARSLAALAVLVSIALTGSAAAAELLRDDFESGNLGNWTVQTGGDGSATVQSSVVQSGTRAARLAATGNTGSFATIKKTFSASQTEFEVEADVRLLAQGANGGNVPLFKLYDAGGTRLVNLFRQNTTNGRLYTQHGSGAFNATNGFLPMDVWRNLRLRVVVVSDGLSTVEVKLDGATIYQTNNASIGTQGVRTLQLGNEVKAQRFDIAIDDVVATNPTTDSDPPETTIDSGPSGDVASTAASFTFSSDEQGTFECKLDNGAWSGCSSPKDYTGLADGEHNFSVRAIDEAGNVDATPAVRTWTVALGDGCDTGAPPPTNGDPGTLVVADNFESGDFRHWTVREQGDAVVRIQSEEVHGGRCASEIDVSNVSWDSRANLIRTLPERTNEVWADGWFNIRTDGQSADWNDATFRFMSEGRRILDVSRQNQNGAAFVRYPNPAGGWKVISLNRTIALDRWYHVRIHAVANGNLSTVAGLARRNQGSRHECSDVRRLGARRRDGRSRAPEPGGRGRRRRRRGQGALAAADRRCLQRRLRERELRRLELDRHRGRRDRGGAERHGPQPERMPPGSPRQPTPARSRTSRGRSRTTRRT